MSSQRLSSWESIEGVILDKDGTLVDFYPTWTPLYLCALEALSAAFSCPLSNLLTVSGFSPRGERLASDSPLVHATPDTILALWASALEQDSIEPLRPVVDRVFAEHYLFSLVPPGDLPALFGKLSKQELRLALVTSDSTRYAEGAVAALGISRWVSPVIGSDAGFPPKPSAAMAIECLKQWRLEPHQVAVIGDHPRDLQMGRALGAGRVVGVLSGSSREDELAPWCDEVWSSLMNLEFLAELKLKKTRRGSRV
ncbi:HAD family hydrolase [Pokkaliibacter sp. CJK22405]|uniref:HAD family hydrolase n=1 Tax=Pokkaliibacter sp. CJK22405 TaxID=3384615 RepID=UPI0039847F96